MRSKIIDADADIQTGAPPGGHLIYSLRDKNGESHISAEYDPNVDMNYIQPIEALGKQNEPPVKKYKPYIQKLDNFFTQHPEKFGPPGKEPFKPDDNLTVGDDQEKLRAHLATRDDIDDEEKEWLLNMPHFNEGDLKKS